MRERIAFYWKRIKEGRLKEMWKQTKWIYGYGKHHWFAMIVYTLLGMVGTVVSLLMGFASRDLVNIITGYQTGKLIQTFCLMIGLGIGSTIMGQITNYVSSWIGMRVDAEIKSDIFEKILVTDWESLTSYHTGDLLTRWNADASNISNGVLNFVPNAIIYSFRFLSAFFVVVYNDASFALFAFLGMPVSLILSKTLMKRMVNNNQRSAAMGAKMSGFNQETFSNIQTIKAFDLIGLYIKRLKQLQKEFITMRLDFQKMSIWTSLLLSTVGLIVSYAAYGWGIYRVWSGAIDYGTMTMFLGLSGTLTGTLHNLTSLIPTAIGLTTSAGRLMDIVEMPRETDEKREEVQKFIEENHEEGIGLTLNKVDYAYKNGTQVFQGASMEARPHEIIGLVGPSGEGKTTMMRILLSLVPIQGGEAYCWAGKDQKKKGFELSPSTRQLFSYVPQGNTMFSGSIAQNMRNVKEDATDEEIIEALKQACAWGFVEKLPEGINSEIQERGGGFSEGQSQRLSIARALLRDTPILLLDEATSALDVATERQVLRNIMGGSRPKTCIVTTHRPTVLSLCERVYAIRKQQCVSLNEAEIKELIDQF
ncbi:MAG: ABC transporter ATP-binding protein [Lachnospiraceae bacterium]|nr:ABC transporter ATP-binding protein [Lachnospiraceae bacterium]